MNKDEKRKLAICIGITVVIMAAITVWMRYLFLPAANIRSVGTWLFVLIMLTVASALFAIIAAISGAASYSGWIAGGPLLASLGLWLVFMVMGIGSAALCQSRDMANVFSYEDGVFEEDMAPVTTVSNVALMDTATAEVFAERALGSLSDVVSQYDLNDTYTQINLYGAPKKVSPLGYDGFFKYNKNKDKGIPGYILVDPVENSAEFVKCTKPITISDSAHFSNKLKRVIRKTYPTKIIDSYYFEIDEEGNPYWIVSFSKPTQGLFGCEVINEVAIFDASTGESVLYDVADVPEWVDIVYDGDYLTKIINWSLKYQNGFWNSVFSKTGCKRCTDDYGYITIGTDIWFYTGVTSMSGDSSDIAVIMVNERTGEAKYYPVSGADENSAMSAAEGEVQQYGYTASFPALVNVNGEPSYIMAMTDANNIIKGYAMVNMSNYSKVCFGETQKEVFAHYAKLMGGDVEPEEPEDEDDTPTVSTKITIEDIQYIVIDGDTVVYVTADDGQVYKSDFDESWILRKKGDTLTVNVAEGDDAIKKIK